MRIGVAKEIKPDERRVAVLPGAVADLVHRGHSVFVQSTAGAGAGAPDEAFSDAGATILESAEDVFDASTLIVHVKEPQVSEIAMLRPDHILFTYLHLAAYPKVAAGLRQSGATSIAYETVERNGGLPLLAPMSHIAGRLSVQVGAFYLMAPNGGMGLLLGGHAGVPPGQVLVIGAGAAGMNAVDVAVGLGHLVQLGVVGQVRGQMVDRLNHRFERLLLAPEFLGPLGLVPDARILERGNDLVESQRLAVVVKDTPEALRFAGSGRPAGCRSG